MQARTAFRLAMWKNGYWPLLNDCKKAIETGWPTRRVDEAEVLSWDRSALTSTGLKLDGDLAVTDVDVSEAALVAALADALDKRFPELFTHGGEEIGRIRIGGRRLDAGRQRALGRRGGVGQFEIPVAGQPRAV